MGALLICNHTYLNIPISNTIKNEFSIYNWIDYLWLIFVNNIVFLLNGVFLNYNSYNKNIGTEVYSKGL